MVIINLLFSFFYLANLARCFVISIIFFISLPSGERSTRSSALEGGWARRVDVVAADPVDKPEVKALLLRPDGHVVWAAPLDAAQQETRTGLRQALTTWFGAPDGNGRG